MMRSLEKKSASLVQWQKISTSLKCGIHIRILPWLKLTVWKLVKLSHKAAASAAERGVGGVRDG